MAKFSAKLLIIFGVIVLCKSGASNGIAGLIRLTFLYGNYSGQTYNVHDLHTILNDVNFDENKITVLYNYGFSQGSNQQPVREVVDAYYDNGNFNFILVNYYSILTNTVFNANEIGSNIADALIKLFQAGYSPEKVHIIGFSLGAQIAGIIGRNVINKSDYTYKIGRITGLDPGQLPPLFGSIIPLLNENDAEFVDTIHTETESFGSRDTVGTVSFWVNGGQIQPMCRSIIPIIAQTCSHLMAPKFWIETIKSPDDYVFPAKQCKNFEEFRRNRCNSSIPLGNMGLFASNELEGRYYLTTNLQSPYSRNITTFRRPSFKHY